MEHLSWLYNGPNRYLYEGGFLVYLGTISVISVIVGAYSRDRLFLRYSIYTLTLFTFYFLRRLDEFFPDQPPISAGVEMVIEAMGTAFIFVVYARFATAFLKLSAEESVADRKNLLRVERVAYFVLLCYLLLLPFGPKALWSASVWAAPVLLAPSIYALWKLRRHTDRYTRILLWGIRILLIGLILFFVGEACKRVWGFVIPDGQLGFIQYAIMLEAMLYWIGCGLRLSSRDKEDGAAEEPTLHIRVGRREYFWPLRRVQGFVAEGEAVRALLDDGREVRIALRMNALENQLPEGVFERVHRSYLLRTEEIEEVKNDRGRVEAKLRDGGHTVRLSRDWWASRAAGGKTAAIVEKC